MAKRTYYRLDIETISPLSIGAFDSVATDADAVLDGRGLPVIPASSLAGVFRSYFSAPEGDAIFGTLSDDADTKVRVYDATWVAGNRAVSVRDSVALKDKVAIEGAKFDRQVVEAGARFVSFIEVLDDTDICPRLEAMLGAVESGGLRFGAKTTRGMGRVRLRSASDAPSVKKIGFDLASQRQDWLNFDMFEQGCWESADIVRLDDAPPERDLVITLGLRLRGALSIREYTTTPSTEAGTEPDYVQLYARDTTTDEAVPVIPGTSWAGAFRDRFSQFAGEDAARGLFGYVDGLRCKKSRVSFAESRLSGGEWKDVTRTAIDRFTGGVVNGSLFTERAYHGGTCELSIFVRDMRTDDIASAGALCACVADLANGFMAVGGLTAVGHGLFEVESAKMACCGRPVEIYDAGFAARPDASRLRQALAACVAGGADERGGR